MKRALVHSRSLGRVVGEPMPPLRQAKPGLDQLFVASLVVAVKPPDERGSSIALLFRRGMADCEHTKVRECATMMII